MNMVKIFYLSGILLGLLLMSSCAGVGALVTITAFGVEGYEEVRVHRPDLKLKPLSYYLTDLTFSSKESSSRKNTKTSASNAPAEFGFDCSSLDDTKKQSKCFDDFSKALAKREEALAKREDQSLKPKNVVTQKKEKKLTALQKVTKTLREAPAKVAKKLSSTTETLPKTYIQSWASAW